ncbi:hypothetical protein B0H17DRAFT_1033283 [Mycena rosella]|uniref:BTB domain-containing protein n=1 Tax=Mycena rosella TaxID=1033263 RepID=A0AAD7GXR5_MYCRO|nr:hypothetical protein B0H17DRAFT_1033283 [Mycena rosella]
MTIAISEQVVPSKKSASGRHPVFWFDDGSLVLQVEAMMFKVHGALLTRQSPFLYSMTSLSLVNGSPGAPQSSADEDYMEIDPARNVSALDLEVLLEHLYHDIPMSPDAPFPRIASAVRVSSPGQLNFPRIHETALRYFADLFPSGPAPFVHPRHLEEALELATSFNVTSIQKGLFYSLVTSTNFDTEGAASPEDDSRSRPSLVDAEKTLIQGNTEPLLKSEPTPQLETPDSAVRAHKYVLPPRDSQRCMRLMTHLIDHFSPILFTAPATPHMACTDVFADMWMTRVIQPAIDDEGVYKPLETLERIKGIDWADAGLCSACVVEKNAEWTEEQQVVWRLMDQWLGL